MLMHICCGPDATYAYEYFSRDFDVTGYYCNHNMDSIEEYNRRADAVNTVAGHYDFEVIYEEYRNELFEKVTEGMGHLPEQSERCLACHRLNMEWTAREAVQRDMDCFSTTLTISPHKMVDKINDIGLELGSKYNVEYIPAVLRKNGGFKHSISISRELQLYRQNYCGCKYSRR